MKAAATYADRVPPALRHADEEVLTDGETLPNFITRGLASRGAAQASGRYVKAATVLGKLERRLKNACKKSAGAN